MPMVSPTGKLRSPWPLAVAALVAAGALPAFCSWCEAQDKVSDERIRVEFSQGKRFGVMIRDSEGKFQKLTCFPGGQTNRTHVRIDGMEPVEFGSPAGRWQAPERNPSQKPLKGTAKNPQAPLQADVSTWVYEHVQITQEVHLVAIDSAVRNTCEVVYAVENLENKKHTVELRVVIDTMIADNDGCTFLPRGGEKPLRHGDFRGEKQVPSELFVLQREDRTGLSARLQLWPLKGLAVTAPPSRFVITRYGAIGRSWDVEAVDIANDSAAVIFWGLHTLEKQRDTLKAGYRYGEGKVK